MAQTKKKIMVVMGTRPEVIKQAPVVQALQRRADECDTRVLLTAQHREMADQMLEVFGLSADHDLNVMQAGQSLGDVTRIVLERIDPILEAEKPDFVVVQGDTTTAFVASLAAFYRQIKVGHVEAGLRTHQKYYPFPEEMNRKLAGSLADLHFAPTTASEQNLLREAVPAEHISVTGNTVIDALQYIVNKENIELRDEIDDSRHMLITMHRRENFGAPMESICDAILTLLNKYPALSVTLPLHPNPSVRGAVSSALGNHPQINLVEPLGYVEFIRAMASSYLIMSDSGGVQEEAPSLNKPVLILRNETERQEGVDAGATRLVGTDKATIIDAVSELMDNAEAYAAMAEVSNPYGDGTAGCRIADLLLAH